MSTARKEYSMVRFAKETRSLPKLTHMYRPELHRQATERAPFSRLGQELTRLCQAGLGEALDPASIAQAKLELTELMDKIVLSLKRNRLGLDIGTPVVLHCFTHWQVAPDTGVVCLLPVTFPKAKVVQKDVGHVLIKPPQNKDKSNHANSHNGHQPSPANSEAHTQADVLSKDHMHVSPRKLHAACAKLLLSSLLKHGVAKERVQINLSASDLTTFVLLDCGWRAEFVTCVEVDVGKRKDSECSHYVARRFSTESYEKGDISWRPCSSIRDQDLLHSISSTDGGLRIKAMHVICRLLSYDWRLGHITCYHVQTALLHDMDFHVDFSPRWQRNTLDSCVRSLLKTLLYFVDRESLPHFELNQLNLWDDMSPRQLSLARGALTRLLTNENALVSLVRRSLNGCTASVDMGLLNIF